MAEFNRLIVISQDQDTDYSGGNQNVGDIPHQKERVVDNEYLNSKHSSLLLVGVN